MRKKQVTSTKRESHPELAKFNDWCEFNGPIDYGNASFIKIIQFFLFETPAENISCRSKSLHDHGWKGTGFATTLKSKLFKSTIGFENYSPVDLEFLYDKLAERNMLKKLNLSSEVAVFYDREESKNDYMAMFVSMRHAFAHGAFDIIDYNETRFYILENREPETSEIRARFILKETTLLQWIDIITHQT